MARCILPAVAVALFVGVMVAIHQGSYAFLEYMGPEFAGGFLVGCGFCGALYYLIQWLERSGAD